MTKESHKSLFNRNRPSRKHQGKGVFISYCHGEGDAFKESLIKELKPLEHEGAEILEDSLMEAGDDWRDKVQKYLHRSCIAILLVTKSVPYSKAILDFELNEIRRRVETGKLRFLWLHVEKSDYKKLDIENTISPHDIQKPLDSDAARQREALKEVFRITCNILRGRQVLVAGSLPDGKTNKQFIKDCEYLGAELIRNRFSLICGSWRFRTADYHCFKGAACQAKREGLPGDAEYIMCIGSEKGFNNQTHPDNEDYIKHPIIMKSSIESRVRQVEQADIVILIGGKSGSGDVVYETAWQRKLVIPSGKHGGSGNTMYKALSRRLKRSITDISPKQIGANNKDRLFLIVDGLKKDFVVESVVELLNVFCRPI
jgi:hypothetical protein